MRKYRSPRLLMRPTCRVEPEECSFWRRLTTPMNGDTERPRKEIIDGTQQIRVVKELPARTTPSARAHAGVGLDTSESGHRGCTRLPANCAGPRDSSRATICNFIQGGSQYALWRGTLWCALCGASITNPSERGLP